jgi:phenylacetate-CoA ligase
LYFFAIQIESLAPDLRKILSNSVKGVFLNSEFPQPHFRNTIEKVFGVPTLSWYGHTERCVLAHEKEEKFLFYPMQTYGWVEAVQDSNGKSKLIGSSYYNFASPFIRYDTGDLIENCKFDSAGILNSFNIYDGRNGEFILDKYLNQISLTGLIFGRHHLLFDYTTCVQVKQEIPGFSTILYVRSEGRLFPYNGLVSEFFDASNINVQFDFQEIAKPILTNSGKLNLLIK